MADGDIDFFSLFLVGSMIQKPFRQRLRQRQKDL
jgi:hypothetical protein